MLALVLGAVLLPLEMIADRQGRASGITTHTPSVSPSASPVVRAPLQAAPRRASRARTTVPEGEEIFSGLGAWLDLYDLNLDVATTVARLKGVGVRTLYVQTGRSITARAIDARVGRWIRAAHRSGIAVVGWYLPYYTDIRRDVARTSVIARAVFGGERFDGLGVDIEYRDAVPRLGLWNRNVRLHLSLVRREVGSDFPVAAITPTPLQMQVAGQYWAGFPWKAIARYSDAVLLMSYWSDRTGCPQIVLHCAYEFTKANVELTRLATGRADVRVHVIGGVGSEITTSDVAGFVRGARDANAYGASVYDVATTRGAWWRRLRVLRTLGEASPSG
ncbi:MAG: hypothetical protein WDA27_03195 [Actinomycetota bacterium]